MNQLNTNTPRERKVLHAALWGLQILWGVFFDVTGFGKMMCYRQDVWARTLPQVAWFSAVPQSLFVVIGVVEFLGGVGLILPALAGVKTKLTPLAGLGLALVMVLAAVFHIWRGEYNFLPSNLVLASVAAFIAYGRVFAVPITPTSSGSPRLVSGFAVLSALLIADLAPFFYTFTHSH